MPLVGYILVLMALFSVGSVLIVVMREHQETEEWYIPPQPGAATEPQQAEERGE